MRNRRALAAIIAVVGLLAAVPAGAETTVAIDTDGVTRSGNSVTVTGTAAFDDATGPVDVGGFLAGSFPNDDLAEAAGINLTNALIEPLADGSGLRFIWQLNSLPAQVPPEVVRYTWAFTIDGRQFQLQAKTSNLANSTTAEDPLGHLQHAATQEPFFQLRGACVTAYPQPPSTVQGCYHLAFLDGAFDIENAQVTIDLPYDTTDAIGRKVAPEFVPGAALVAFETAASSIGASMQAGVSNATTTNSINGWDTYYTTPQVTVGVGRTASAATSVLATLGDSDSFTATVTDLPEVTTNFRVFVEACKLTDCASAPSQALPSDSS